MTTPFSINSTCLLHIYEIIIRISYDAIIFCYKDTSYKAPPYGFTCSTIAASLYFVNLILIMYLMPENSNNSPQNLLAVW